MDIVEYLMYNVVVFNARTHSIF